MNTEPKPIQPYQHGFRQLEWLKLKNIKTSSKPKKTTRIQVKSLLQRLQDATNHWSQSMSLSTGWSSGADLGQELCCYWWSDLPPPGQLAAVLSVCSFPSKKNARLLGKSAWTTTALCLKYIIKYHNNPFMQLQNPGFLIKTPWRC